MPRSAASRPRLGFLGLGWIGRHRLQAIADSGVAEVAALADPDPQALAAAATVARGAVALDGLEALLAHPLEGLVIATPSAMHARVARAALDAGLAVFCQKPLAISAADTAAVLDAARRADRLLGVDFSYREATALERVRALAAGGELGDVFAWDLTFHNAYGPDKPWFYDPALAGGGCVMDLGSHLVDFLHRASGAPAVLVESALFAAGTRLTGRPPAEVEDFAAATLHLEGGALARLSCSWRLSAGRDAQIEVAAYGTRGAAVFRNVNGSFYDFVAEKHEGTRRQTLVEPPDAWGGRAAVSWATQLAGARGFDPSADSLLQVAETLDRIYGRLPPAAGREGSGCRSLAMNS